MAKKGELFKKKEEKGKEKHNILQSTLSWEMEQNINLHRSRNVKLRHMGR